MFKCISFILFSFLELQCFAKGENSFIASFQTEADGAAVVNTNSWIQFSEPIPSVKEFTTCHWLKIRFYNINIAACLWSYCIVENAQGKMKCVQMCLYGVRNTANSNLLMEGALPLQSYQGVKLVIKNLNSYRHRTWVHLCWSFSAKTGQSKFYNDDLMDKVQRIVIADVRETPI